MQKVLQKLIRSTDIDTEAISIKEGDKRYRTYKEMREVIEQ